MAAKRRNPTKARPKPPVFQQTPADSLLEEQEKKQNLEETKRKEQMEKWRFA